MDELRDTLGKMESSLLEKDREIASSKEAYEYEVNVKRKLENLLRIEKEQHGILEVNVSVLESKMVNLQQRVENIILKKLLLSDEDDITKQNTARKQSIDDVLISIEDMCDKKNATIRHFENDRSRLHERLEHIMTKAHFSNEGIEKQSCDNNVKSFDDRLSNIETMCNDKNTLITQLLEELETIKECIRR